MRRTVLLLILCLAIVVQIQARTLFQDDFNDFTKISTNNNIMISGGNAYVSNYYIAPGGKTGWLTSTIITKQANDKWGNISITYSLTNLAASPINYKITLYILDNINQQIGNITFNQSEDNTEKIDLNSQFPLISDYQQIKLKFELFGGIIGITPYRTPNLDHYILTVQAIEEQVYPPKNQGFYGAPSPLEISEDGCIRFYYEFENKSTITIKIYDTNYNLVAIVADSISYPAHSFLDSQWCGKNGNNIAVMSGVYIAIMEIKDSEGTSSKDFKFAIIR